MRCYSVVALYIKIRLNERTPYTAACVVFAHLANVRNIANLRSAEQFFCQSLVLQRIVYIIKRKVGDSHDCCSDVIRRIVQQPNVLKFPSRPYYCPWRFPGQTLWERITFLLYDVSLKIPYENNNNQTIKGKNI